MVGTLVGNPGEWRALERNGKAKILRGKREIASRHAE